MTIDKLEVGKTYLNSKGTPIEVLEIKETEVVVKIPYSRHKQTVKKDYALYNYEQQKLNKSSKDMLNESKSAAKSKPIKRRLLEKKEKIVIKKIAGFNVCKPGTIMRVEHDGKALPFTFKMVEDKVKMRKDYGISEVLTEDKVKERLSEYIKTI